MGAFSGLQSGLNSLSSGLSKSLQFAEGVLGSAASIQSSLNTFKQGAASSLLPKTSAGATPSSSLAFAGPIGPPAPPAASSSVPTLLLFVAALVVVVLIARK